MKIITTNIKEIKREDFTLKQNKNGNDCKMCPFLHHLNCFALFKRLFGAGCGLNEAKPKNQWGITCKEQETIEIQD